MRYVATSAALLLVAAVGSAHAEDSAAMKFAAPPAVTKDGAGAKIAFELAAPADVEVGILDKGGNVVRHLAAGLLGGQVPPPAPLAEGLKQDLSWDGKDDNGKEAANGPFSARVRLGLGVKLDGFLNENRYHVGGFRALATDETGNLYVFASSTGNHAADGTPYLQAFDREGKYLRTLLPFRPDLTPEQAKAFGMLAAPGSDVTPRNLRGTWPELAAHVGGALANRVQADGCLYFFDWRALGRLTADGRPKEAAFARTVWAKGQEPSGPDFRYKISASPNVAVAPDAKTVYVTGIRDKKPGGKFPAGRVYRLTSEGLLETFADLADVASTSGMTCDAQGNVYVCTNKGVSVLDAAGKERGGLKVEHAREVRVHRKSGAVYVLSIGKEGYFSAPKTLSVFNGAGDAAPAVAYKLPDQGRFATMALDDSGADPVVWVGLDRTKGANPFNLNAPARLVRLVQSDSAFTETPHPIKWADGPMGVVTRLAVHPQSDRILCRGEYAEAAAFDGVTGARIETPFKNTPDFGLGLDGNFYVQLGDTWLGAIGRYDKDFKPVPTAGLPAGAKLPNLAGYAFGRYGNGLGNAGMMADAAGRLYTLQQLNEQTIAGDCVVTFAPDGKPQDGGRMKDHETIVKHHKQFSSVLFGPIATVVGGIAVDHKGFMYIGLRCYPEDHVPPPGFEKDAGYWTCTGSVLKVRPEGGSLFVLGGKDSRPQIPEKKVPEGMQGLPMTRKNCYPCGPSFVEGAVKAYAGLGSMSGGYGAGCRCRQPMFALDEWGRLFVPNAFTYSVQVFDNESNLIKRFGAYANADARGAAEDSLYSAPEVPLGWPEAVGVSERYVYVADVLNRRIARLKKTYAAEETREIK